MSKTIHSGPGNFKNIYPTPKFKLLGNASTLKEVIAATEWLRKNKHKYEK